MWVGFSPPFELSELLRVSILGSICGQGTRASAECRRSPPDASDVLPLGGPPSGIPTRLPSRSSTTETKEHVHKVRVFNGKPAELQPRPATAFGRLNGVG